MSFRMRLIVLLAGLSLAPASVGAQGHMLHGMGPINSSLGGAGTALPEDSVAAMMWNPALIGATPGNQISFTTEFFTNLIKIDVNAFGRTAHSEGEQSLGIIPSFGWNVKDPTKKMGLGFALIGIAGFRTDYATDDNSIIFARPINGGFGRIFTDYGVLKIPVGFSYQVTPKLTLGAQLNTYRANLDICPLPYVVVDTSSTQKSTLGLPVGYYPCGGNSIGRFAFAGQFGFLYTPNPMMSVGASITTPQNYSPFKWNSTFADPTSSTFLAPRTHEYDLDGPMVFNYGVGLHPNMKTAVAVDGVYVKYSGVSGFGSPGGIILVNGVPTVQPFGWKNINAIKAGVMYQASPTMDVRFGYSYSQTPIVPDKVLTSTGAPATFQNHFTAGAGIKVFPFLTLEASFYYVPREHVKGLYLTDQLAIPSLRPAVPGTQDTSNQLTSALIGLNFRF